MFLDTEFCRNLHCSQPQLQYLAREDFPRLWDSEREKRRYMIGEGEQE